jgi:hypothetical protein
MINCADDSTGATAKSICSKLLIGTVKRVVSSVEASFELSGLALYRSYFAVAPVLSSAQLIMSFNKSITAPVGWLPLQAYPVTYFSVASISSIDGLLGSLLDNITDMSPLNCEVTQPS